MKQLLIKKGVPVTSEVHKPSINKNEILVKTKSSCLSVGTEMESIKKAKESIFKKILKNPSNITKVLKILKTDGLSTGFYKVKGKVNQYKPSGYSSSGIILDMGSNVNGFKIGDRVACAGGGYAYHSEILCVPQNLVVKVPENVSFNQSSTVALGAIAMQGVRRFNATLGECVAVVGLGLLGQITQQLLIASGCRVVSIDLNPERLKIAKKNGAWKVFNPNEVSNLSKIGGDDYPHGIDGVIITAGSKSNKIIANSFEMCRKKARVVIVGDVGLNLKREDFYAKEIDVRISCSYGPGRYDNLYEEKSYEYPLPYVRWSEKRNMSEYLKLICENRINIDDLINNTVNMENAETAYETLKNTNKEVFTTIIEYDGVNIKEDFNINLNSKIHGKINVGLIGLGNFTKLKILPELVKNSSNVKIEGIVSKNGYSASNILEQYKLKSFTTSDYNKLIVDNNINTVFILTRHNLHFEMINKSLLNGKNVYVEKPTVMSHGELLKLKKIIKDLGTNCPMIHTGYNRRFSPHIKFAKKKLDNRIGEPIVINMRINAGYIPYDHWVHSDEGGGRNIGEACHFYDLLCFLTDSEISEISTSSYFKPNDFNAKTDNFIVNFRFKNNSIATLTYVSCGSSNQEKERIEIFFDEKSLVISDYKNSTIYSKSVKTFNTEQIEKGHKEHIQEYLKSLKQNKQLISINEQLKIMDVTFQIDKLINS